VSPIRKQPPFTNTNSIPVTGSFITSPGCGTEAFEAFVEGLFEALSWPSAAAAEPPAASISVAEIRSGIKVIQPLPLESFIGFSSKRKFHQKLNPVWVHAEEKRTQIGLVEASLQCGSRGVMA
jgi:hypothetical protein